MKTIPARRTDLSITTLGENTIILDGQSHNQIHELNEVAGFIWGHLSDPQTEEFLLQRLVETYDVDLSVAQQDLTNLISDFLNKGLLLSEKHE